MQTINRENTLNMHINHTWNTYVRNYCILFLFLLFASCHKNTDEKLICIYNTESGFWRTQMSEEMMYEAAQHHNLRLVFRTKQSGDETEEEMNALEEFIGMKPDAIIFVSDNHYLRNHFRQAQMKGIPIILLNNTDPKVTYTARITNNNVKAGRDAAHYLIDRLQGHGRILVIKGVSASAEDRTIGFNSVADSFPNIEIVENIEGEYSRPVARDRVIEFLQQTDRSEPINAVFAQNDRMAIGAHEAFDAFEETKSWNTIFFGIDGLMCDSVGIERLLDGGISTSMLLPTGGREAISQAINIIEGRPFTRDIELNAHLITRDSVPQIRKRWREIVQRYQNATNKQTQTQLRQKRYSQIEVYLWFCLAVIVVLLITVARLYRHLRNYINKVEEMSNTIEDLRHENNRIQQQHTILETERNLLKDQRNRWFDLRAVPEQEEEDEEVGEQGTFRNRLLSIIRKHMEDESCNVETLCTKINLSRVQLNRKVKAEFNMSPGDLLRKTRMEHAMHLLRTSDFTISEVAYRVGYSNGKYFTRTFKDQFNCTPSEVKREK